jgi:hypothetical protein
LEVPAGARRSNASVSWPMLKRHNSREQVHRPNPAETVQKHERPKSDSESSFSPRSLNHHVQQKLTIR